MEISTIWGVTTTPHIVPSAKNFFEVTKSLEALGVRARHEGCTKSAQNRAQNRNGVDMWVIMCYTVGNKTKGCDEMRKNRIVISLTDAQIKYVEQEAKAKGLTKSAVIALLIEGAKSHGKEKKYA